MLRKTLVMSAALMFATAVSGQAQDMTLHLSENSEHHARQYS